MIMFVLDDGETWTLAEPTPVVVTPEQLSRIEGGEKVYNVVEDWAEQDVDWWLATLPILDFVYSALSDDEGVSQETWHALRSMLQALGCKSLMTAVGRNVDGCDDRVFFPSKFEKKDLIAALRSVNKEEK